MGGICTATEAGAIAVVYSLVVSLFITRTLKIRDMGAILLSAANSAAPLLLIIACAKVFSYGLTALQMPVLVNDLILSITDNKWVFLLLVNILLLIMGMFMDGGAAVIILAPILAPVAASMGISLVHFGIVMCLISPLVVSRRRWAIVCSLLVKSAKFPLKTRCEEQCHIR